MSYLNFVHISDMHIGIECLKDRESNVKLRKALSNRLQSLSTKTDICLCTGDLVNVISREDQMAIDLHDTVEINKRDALHQFFESFNPDKKLNTYNTQGNHDKCCDNQYNAFEKYDQYHNPILTDNCPNGASSWYIYTKNIDGVNYKIAVLTVNSSLNCSKNSTLDYSNLRLNIDFLTEKEEDKIKACDIVVTLIHHPPLDLYYREIYDFPEDGRYFKLKELSDFILYGHSHIQSFQNKIKISHQNSIGINCGALFIDSKKQYLNSFFPLINIEPNEKKYNLSYLLYNGNNSYDLHQQSEWLQQPEEINTNYERTLSKDNTENHITRLGDIEVPIKAYNGFINEIHNPIINLTTKAINLYRAGTFKKHIDLNRKIPTNILSITCLIALFPSIAESKALLKSALLKDDGSISEKNLTALTDELSVYHLFSSTLLYHIILNNNIEYIGNGEIDKDTIYIVDDESILINDENSRIEFLTDCLKNLNDLRAYLSKKKSPIQILFSEIT